MIRFSDVSYRVGDTKILSEVSFHVAAGQKACLTGPSGSGKSTVLKLAMGILMPVSGAVEVAGQELGPSTLPEIRSRIAYIDQEAVMGAETVREAMLLPYRFKANQGREPEQAELEDALRRVGLEPAILAKATRVVSGGERQRVAIARAVLMKKEIFVVDEVTSALDAENRRLVTRFLLEHEATLLAVSHDESSFAEFDMVLGLAQGCVRLVADSERPAAGPSSEGGGS